MSRRGWTWAVFRWDGSFVGLYQGQAHAKRDLGIDRTQVATAGCYRLVVDDFWEHPYYMFRVTSGEPDQLHLPWWLRESEEQRKLRRIRRERYASKGKTPPHAHYV